MGSGQSTGLAAEDIEELQAEGVNFTPSELRRLWKRFQRLDKQGQGVIGTDDMLAIPELAMNPLVMRIISQFDESGDDEVNFKQFVKTLNTFSPRTPVEDRVRFAFNIYDIRRQNRITGEDLFEVLKMMVGTHLDDAQVERIAQKTIQEVGTDGEISFEQFRDTMLKVNLMQKMSIRV